MVSELHIWTKIYIGPYPFTNLLISGHTKIFFRAGILGLMEEIRDDCINNLVAMMQGSIRAYYARRIYNRLWKHKMGLLVSQRAIRSWPKRSSLHRTIWMR